MAPLPPQDVDRVAAWCRTRLPESVHDAVRTECDVDDGHVTIIESRIPVQGGSLWSRCAVARLEYSGTWALYWRDRQGNYQHYDFLPASGRVDDLLTELDRDPVSVFWR
ncbi:MAG TPA: DUF3024 domain-containing protein [Actinomycetales bacterium]|nr:DUF3024 domain-containing protein [Actinomycetales bacterium]